MANNDYLRAKLEDAFKALDFAKQCAAESLPHTDCGNTLHNEIMLAQNLIDSAKTHICSAMMENEHNAIH